MRLSNWLGYLTPASVKLGTRSMLWVRNMVEIVLGALVVIGVFVFWCDVTDSWNNVFLWNKTGKH